MRYIAARGRWVLPLAAGALMSVSPGALGQVKWSSMPEAPVVNAGRDVADAASKLAGRGIERRVVAQLTRPITDDGRQQLAARGLVVGTYLGNNAFFVTLLPGVDAKGVAASGWVSALAPVQARAKIHRGLAGPDATRMFVRDPLAAGPLPADPSVPLYVTFHPDALDGNLKRAIVAKHAGVNKGELVSVNTMVVEMPLSAINGLAGEDIVQWIEPALPPMGELNDQARAMTQVDQLQASPYNLTGTGVQVFVFDGGRIYPDHVDLTGRITVVDTNGAAVSSHATHVAGSVGGTGTGNPLYKGMAPGVTYFSAGVSTAGGQGWLYTNMTDVEIEYTAACQQGADIATNSIGTNTGTNGFPCDWYGDYGAVSAWVDSVVRGDSAITNNLPLRVTWANGNERQSTRCWPDASGYGTMAPPANAKNQMGIGALNSDNDTMTTFSSWGPSQDGRMKPDFSGPGCQTGAGITSCTSASPTSYGNSCGTSMSTPVTAGSVALMIQDYRDAYPGLPDPPNSFFKALLAQTAADDVDRVGPDYRRGYGSIRVRDAVDVMRMGGFAVDSVAQDGIQTYNVVIPGGAPFAKFTLAWDDYPGTGSIITGLVNNLDLVVTDPNGVRRYPWSLNPASPDTPAVQTAENLLDNLEQVYVASPPAGTWTVQVRGTTVPQGPQTFSLAGSVVLDPPPLALSPVTLAESLVAPGTAIPVALGVYVFNDTLVPGSVRVYSRGDNGAWQSTPLTNTSGSTWSGQIGGFPCGSTPQYYFSAEGVTAGTVLLPSGGATAPYSTAIGSIEVGFSDTFETDTGWTTPMPEDNAIAGRWERADPVGTFTGTTPVQPEDDYTDPGTMCLVTGAATLGSFSANDVDPGGGFTTVRSPAINLVGQANATVFFRGWMYTSMTTGIDDYLNCDVSPDGTTWTNAVTINTAGRNAWNLYSFRLGDVLPNPTATTYFRFRAGDGFNSSVLEAAVDDFLIQRVVCNGNPCIGDFNNSGGTPDDADVAAFFAAWNAGDPSADVNGSGGTPDDADVTFFFVHWNAGC